jgi:hypothetical protein
MLLQEVGANFIEVLLLGALGALIPIVTGNWW